MFTYKLLFLYHQNTLIQINKTHVINLKNTKKNTQLSMTHDFIQTVQKWKHQNLKSI